MMTVALLMCMLIGQVVYMTHMLFFFFLPAIYIVLSLEGGHCFVPLILAGVKNKRCSTCHAW